MGVGRDDDGAFDMETYLWRWGGREEEGNPIQGRSMSPVLINNNVVML